MCRTVGLRVFVCLYVFCVYIYVSVCVYGVFGYTCKFKGSIVAYIIISM